ncbi:chemotaxis protein CheW [Geothrix campi]|uniref:chemotaxis protein CheW n=1 Tax=Geothrix campi TaxID=2966450 RepID=UPI0021494030
MSETLLLLHARAAGREILLPVSDLREVVASTAVTPLPGGPPGIQGVVLHQGEFLPVLDWTAIQGCPARLEPTVAIAVLRPRLGLPLEGLTGTVAAPVEGWLDSVEGDPWGPILAGLCRIGDRDLHLLDPDRLLAMLHRLRKGR